MKPTVAAARELYLGAGQYAKLPQTGWPSVPSVWLINPEGTDNELIPVPAPVGVSGAIQSSDGSGGLADSGLLVNGGDLTVPGNVTFGGVQVTPFVPTENYDSTITYSYFGLDPASGWVINRYDNDGTKTQATEDNNGGTTDLATAWTNRLTLTYG